MTCPIPKCPAPEHSKEPWTLSNEIRYTDRPEFPLWNVLGEVGGKSERTIATIEQWLDQSNARTNAVILAHALTAIHALVEIYEAMGGDAYTEYGMNSPETVNGIAKGVLDAIRGKSA